MMECMERENVYACWLCNFPGIGNKQMFQLMEICGSMENIYFADRGKWGQVLSEKHVNSLVEYTARWKPEEEYCKMRKMGISLLNIWQKEYPQALKEIPDPPFGVFIGGKLPKLAGPTVAIIGARDCSEYGRYMARELGTALGNAQVTVVSGMARGIDGIAQSAALAAGGTSIGVLGCGVDVCYPTGNKALYNELLMKGAVVSFYPLKTVARPQNFPPRNRIVSGLADAVIVVEARARSGTLITVDAGLEQGKEIYAVPGRITDRLSDGCNYLIKQGAGMIVSPKEFLDELWELWQRKQNVQTDENRTAIMRRSLRKYKGGDEHIATIVNELSPELADIYRVLDSSNAKSVDDIVQSMHGLVSGMQISTYLMRLCMEKKAVQISPGQFCRVES